MSNLITTSAVRTSPATEQLPRPALSRPALSRHADSWRRLCFLLVSGTMGGIFLFTGLECIMSKTGAGPLGASLDLSCTWVGVAGGAEVGVAEGVQEEAGGGHTCTG